MRASYRDYLVDLYWFYSQRTVPPPQPGTSIVSGIAPSVSTELFHLPHPWKFILSWILTFIHG